MTALQAYDYCFYCLYRGLFNRWGAEDGPEWSACLLLAFSPLLNLETIWIVTESLTPGSVPPPSRAMLLTLLTLLVLANWARFLRPGRFRLLATRFEPCDSKFRAGWIYVVGSFGCLFVAALSAAFAESAV